MTKKVLGRDACVVQSQGVDWLGYEEGDSIVASFLVALAVVVGAARQKAHVILLTRRASS